MVARFRREAEACSKLRNPHTVITYDFDETEDGILYLAMELLRGRRLQDVAAQRGAAGARAGAAASWTRWPRRWARPTTRGIVHRDMKPENVMVETPRRRGLRQGAGLRHRQDRLERPAKAAPALTAVGQTLGTLEFMSPEQLRGQPLDGRSDIYALGMMAYEMLTGQLPFDERREPDRHHPVPPAGRPAAALAPAPGAEDPARGGRRWC